MRILFLLASIICVVSCGDAPIPKPPAYLRLEYPEATYQKTTIALPFAFEKNTLATNIITKPLQADTESYGITVEYPSLKGTIYLTYKKVNNNKENLMTFLKDAQNFTQKHTMKADEITEQLYMNDTQKVYGMFYEVGGNAASQSQFYATDSINHFITGSLYFYAKPNFDSILPAAHYLKNDIKHLMETLVWK